MLNFYFENQNWLHVQDRAVSSSEKINIDFVCKIVNFGSLNFIILKKKSKNTTKYHNIFTISSFLGSEYIYIYILFEKKATFITFF